MGNTHHKRRPHATPIKSNLPPEEAFAALFSANPALLPLSKTVFDTFITETHTPIKKQFALFEEWVTAQDSPRLLRLLASKLGPPSVSTATQVLTYVYALAVASDHFNPSFASVLSVSLNLDSSQTHLANSDIVELCRAVVPCLLQRPTGLSHMYQKLLQNGARKAGVGPQKSQILSDEELWIIANATPLANSCLTANPPVLLFSLDRHGMSWTRCVTQINHYQAPMVLAIKTKRGHVLGAFIDSGLEEAGAKYFGTAQTFLYALRPTHLLCLASGTGENYVTFNHKAQYVPTGLGFGGDESNHRLFLNSDLHTLAVTYSDKTYRLGELIPLRDEDGSLTYKKEVEIEEIEVWGYGSEADLIQQQRMVERHEELKADARQVDRAMFADNAFDREFLMGGHKMHGARVGEVEAIQEEYRAERHAKEMALASEKRDSV
eukprot:Protomagalhaensia_sp_Gyna_25__113@NODE_1056_length_2242_cov_31_924648_g841_i0_p1_GENE_NODE_1056_length_2242_cov_31_924648_g841_i0NODE_1056_length_2242_cov_31_924648_g841_i0_p1_ORF_typecomplete_len436_score55_19TLD/PF07534_16/5_4e25DNA_alkylation/PF08713_11/7_2DNA_alkylation/PF08713_11/28SUKH4/PF14435_6/7_8e03SUKH4/PF14435_6/0_18_NODE_1056_length_2242_cov_31_924648_g841_i0551362